MPSELDETILEALYTWIDGIPLTRPKKDLKRDFSDGVLVAEVVKHYYPHYVELHNYAPAQAVSKKTVNWHVLNRKVFRKFGFEVSDDIIHSLVTCKPWSAEQFLLLLRQRLDTHAACNVNSDADLPESVSAQASPRQFGDCLSTGLEKTCAGLVSRKSLHGKTGDVSSEEKVHDIIAKDETIQMLHAKIRRLEHLLHLKDVRIVELQARASQLEKKLALSEAAGKAKHKHTTVI